MTKEELRAKINDMIVCLSEQLLSLEGDEAEIMQRIDARAAELMADGMPKAKAYEQAGIEILGPVEKARRQAERAERSAGVTI